MGRLLVDRQDELDQGVVRVARARLDLGAGRHVDHLPEAGGRDQGHDGQVTGQLLVVDGQPKADWIEPDVPVSLVAVAPTLVALGLGLGHFGHGHLGDGRKKTNRAVNRRDHAGGPQRQFLIVQRQVRVDRACRFPLGQCVRLRSLDLGQHGCGPGPSRRGDPPPRPTPPANRRVGNQQQGCFALIAQWITIAEEPILGRRRDGRRLSTTHFGQTLELPG